MASAFTINETEANHLAESLRHGRNYLNFTNQANRNWVAKLARQKGIQVSKGSIRNQLLDPRYTVEGSAIPDRGLANDYRRYHAVIYKIEVNRFAGW